MGVPEGGTGGVSDKPIQFLTVLKPVFDHIRVDPESVGTEKGLKNAAEKMQESGATGTTDEIVGYLRFFRDHTIDLTPFKEGVGDPGNPKIPKPDIDYENEIKEVRNLVETNPHLKAVPFATFFSLYMELISELAILKRTEAEEMSETIMLMTAMAIEVKNFILEAGEAESAQQLAMGIASCIGGALQIIGAGVSRWGTKATGFELQRDNMAWQGVSQISTGIAQIVSSQYILKKAAAEGMKEVTQNLQKLYERRLNAELDAYKSADEMITQLLQNLQKVFDEAYKAHGWQTH